MGLKSSKTSQSITKQMISIPKKDLTTLKTLGFAVEEMIGFGDIGSVYRGRYGSSATGIKDFEGQQLEVIPNKEFAVKYIDVRGIERLELNKGRVNQFERVRRFIEKEKEFQHELDNSAILRLRFCINLGDFRPICLNQRAIIATDLTDISIRPSYDRLYVFMDFAQFGNIGQYLEHLTSEGKKVSQTDAILWMRILLSALEYLIEMEVTRTNLKVNNVLMFEEMVQEKTFSRTTIVPKLSDFIAYNYFDDQWDAEFQESFEDEEEEEEELDDEEEAYAFLEKQKRARYENEEESEDPSDTEEALVSKVSEESEKSDDQMSMDGIEEPEEVLDGFQSTRKEVIDDDHEMMESLEDEEIGMPSEETESSSSSDLLEDIDVSNSSDICRLAHIFDLIVAKTLFETESIRLLAEELIESMKDFSVTDCDSLLSNEIFKID